MVPDTMIIRYFPAALAVVFTGFFVPTGYWALWRVVWRMIPILNAWVFPDLNGIWVGKISSNLPTSEEKEPSGILNHWCDVTAVKITNNLFSLRIGARLHSTDDKFNSITVMPWRDQNAGTIHISYVYQQSTDDGRTYFGVADLQLDDDNFSKVEGTYAPWQAQRTGRNTAGTLRLKLNQDRKDTGKGLKEYAADAHRRMHPRPRPPNGDDDPPDSRIGRLINRLWPF